MQTNIFESNQENNKSYQKQSNYNQNANQIDFINYQQHSINTHWWYQQRTQLINDPIIRFHNQIIDFYLCSQPELSEHTQRIQIFHHFQKLWQQYGFKQQCTVIAPFLTNKLYLKAQPIQIFLIHNNPLELQNNIVQCMEQIGTCGIQLETSLQNKSNNLALKGIIGCKNLVVYGLGLGWLDFLNSISDTIENISAFKYIYYVISQMIISRQHLSNSIASYLLYGIIAAFFNYQRTRNRTQTDTILKLLEYYGMGPLHESKIIYRSNSNYQIKQDKDKYIFEFWISTNIEISCNQLKDLFALFKNRYRLMSNYNFINQQSILAWLINPKIAGQ